MEPPPEEIGTCHLGTVSSELDSCNIRTNQTYLYSER